MKSKDAPEKGENSCLWCGKIFNSNEDNVFVCTGCFDASFCSPACQKSAWPTHRFDCLSCHVCGERIPGTKVTRSCECKTKEGFVHVKCLVKVAAEDSGSNDWDHSSRFWEQCKICDTPFTGEVKEHLAEQRQARVELAKGKLRELREVLDRRTITGRASSISNDEYLAFAQEYITVHEELYGGGDWSCDDYVLARIYLGQALKNCGRFDEALNTLEVTRAKLIERKAKSHKFHTKLLLPHLVDVYIEKKMYREALPLLEEWYEKHYSIYDDEDGGSWCLNNLCNCYTMCRDWKKAREVAKKACVRTLDLYGNSGPLYEVTMRYVAPILLGARVSAISHSIEGFEDGTVVEIDKYIPESGGKFIVSIKSSKMRGSDDVKVFTVPVDNVIMEPESDVVLHSLKGAKHLNGKTGVAVEFDHDIGRYKVIVEGSSKAVNVKPENLLPQYMEGKNKDEMIELAKALSSE